MSDDQETKRGRVRRLLLEPLGFRKPRSMSEEEERRALDRICDDLAYLSDEGLRRVEAVMRTKGEGTRRDFWPALATFRGFAEIAEPRPLEELPVLRRWFASVEGPRAIEAGTLVETYEFFKAHKRPPVYPADRKRVETAARDHARRLTIVRERREAGLSILPSELEFERAYLRRREAVAALVATVQGERAEAAE